MRMGTVMATEMMTTTVEEEGTTTAAEEEEMTSVVEGTWTVAIWVGAISNSFHPRHSIR